MKQLRVWVDADAVRAALELQESDPEICELLHVWTGPESAFGHLCEMTITIGDEEGIADAALH